MHRRSFIAATGAAAIFVRPVWAAGPSLERRLADFALAEAGGHSGRAFIAALVAGYGASARINDAVSFMERGFHPLCAMA